MNHATKRSAICRPWSPVRLDESSRVTIVRGEGCTVWDSNGNSYLDAKSGNLAVSCGYGCQPIVSAMEAQARRLAVFDTIGFDVDITSTYADALVGAMPPAIEHVFFANSGSEATECAIVIARACADADGAYGRRTILRLDRGYHGTTASGMAASGLPGNQRPDTDQPPGFVSVSTDDWSSLTRALEPVERLLRGEGPAIAGVLIEPILGIAGVIVPPPGFLPAVASMAREVGAIVIVDEVLTGMGRTGAMFAVEHEDVQPDILLASKGLTSGYIPLSAVGMTNPVYERLSADPVIHGLRYGHTSSGHPLACAAGMATLQFVQDMKLVQRAQVYGKALMDGLADLHRSPGVRDIRGLGLLIGLELDTDAAAEAATGEIFRRGVLVRSQANVITIAPPLVIDEAEREKIADAVRAGVKSALSH